MNLNIEILIGNKRSSKCCNKWHFCNKWCVPFFYEIISIITVTLAIPNKTRYNYTYPNWRTQRNLVTQTEEKISKTRRLTSCSQTRCMTRIQRNTFACDAQRKSFPLPIPFAIRWCLIRASMLFDPCKKAILCFLTKHRR